MRRIDQNGFTIVEFIVAFCMMSFLLLAALSCENPARLKAREAEVKANLHTIQIALERYASDHLRTYPPMIWGGSIESWSNVEGKGCRVMREHEKYNGINEDSAVPPVDPLIKYGYLSSYPVNPFAYDKFKYSGEKIIKWTGIESAKYGDGDPRFGVKGNLMGNILEDPRYLWKSRGEISRIKNCLPDDTKTNNTTMINKEGKINPFYSMGGLPNALENHWTSDDTGFAQRYQNESPAVTTISAFWPGQFFYRSAGTFIFPERFLFTTMPDPKMTTIWQFPYTKIDKYLLGCYGSWTTDGMDAIRLTDVEGKPVNNLDGCNDGVFYKPHSKYRRTSSSPIHFSSPEVMGGGDHGAMPYFPYMDPEKGWWVYGAPDGYKDGLVLLLVPEV